MRGTLKVDTAMIAEAATNVSVVRSTLDSAPADAQSLASKIPVETLSSAAVEFSDKWELTRKELLEELEQLKQQLSAIATGFDDTDSGLADALRDALK